jgi:hypothetical protein
MKGEIKMEQNVNETDFEQDISIDVDALDVEVLRCGIIGKKYIRLAGHLRRLEKQAHEAVKNIRSDLINKVNENPEKTTGKAKPNAADIEAYYRRDKEYKAAKQDWIDAEYEADFAERAQQEATYGRRKDLEHLIRLFERSYFAGPALPRDLSKEWGAKNSAGVAKAMNRTKKA